jgi:transposase, IS30 family
MAKKYFQLTQAHRHQIEALLSAGLKQTKIAKTLGVSRSTISRELKRNVPKRGKGAKKYSAENAQVKTDIRHKTKPKHIKFTDDLKAFVHKQMTEEKWSPELIASKLKKEKKPYVSPETIYTFLWIAKFSNKKKNLKFKRLHKWLRHGKRRRKRSNYKENRGLIPNRVSIEKRSPVVERRERLGDIEVDLIIGKNHKSGLLVTLDRATMVTTIDKIDSKKPGPIKQLIVKRMKDNAHLKTMTFDNDMAFSLHEEIADELHLDTYFTRPYTSQDKGSIENRNGLIRMFYPKKTDFNDISEYEIKKVEQMINNRPVRKFGYKTPNEIYLEKEKVAVMT